MEMFVIFVLMFKNHMDIKLHTTIPEILHKLEIIEIQLKMLFDSYRSFLDRFIP
jgi:hypothetical protein